MITGAARRQTVKRLHRNLVYSYEQLELPWLCPAVDRHVRQSRMSSSDARNPPLLQRTRSRSPSKATQTPDSARHLATEAAAYVQHEDDVPFHDLPSHLERHRGNYTKLRPWDPNRIIMIGSQVASTLPVFKRPQQSTITGDIAELLPNLYACIQVGRLDRAAKLVHRMSKWYLPDAPELLDAHHQYMLGLLKVLLAEPSKERLAQMHRWFELEIRGRGTVPDSRILAIMMKATFAVHDGTLLDRNLRQYLDIADKGGSEIKAAAMASELLTEAQMARLIRLQPQEFNPPNEELTAQRPLRILTERPPLDLSTDELAAIRPTAPESSSQSIQELKPAELKGLGLKTLKHSLDIFYTLPKDVSSSSDADAATIAYERQRLLEAAVTQASIDRWREEAETNRSMRAAGQLTNSALGALVYEWLQDVAKLVREEISLATAAEETEEGSAKAGDLERLLLSPFLRCCSAEKLAAAAIANFMQTVSDIKLETGTDRQLTTLVSRMGIAICNEIRASSLQSNDLAKLRALPSPERRRKLRRLLKENSRVIGAQDDIMSAPTSQETPPTTQLEFSSGIYVKVGALFLSMIAKVAKLPVSKKHVTTGATITEMQPVGAHTWTWKNGKKIGVFRVNQALLERMKREPVVSFITKQLPMVMKPQRWRGLDRGPYLTQNPNVVRFRDSSHAQYEYTKIAIKRGDMEQVLRGLDVLGSVPWKISTPLFKVLSEAWNTGEGFAKLAPEHPTAEHPPPPPPTDYKAVQKWRRTVRAIENQLTGYHSQRCYQNFQLEVARAYAGEEAFYCPHNVDFRGRAYPVPPYFNHMGADYVRGLFLFSKGKKLGETGLRWLKIHLANMYGFDKERLDDREKFAMDHLPEIYDSAENALSGNRWWVSAGHPWQCLAACMELKAALDSPVPTEFVSHLPVQQDGTCNGLQHYAALGGDVIGAKQVNLMPGDKPADIYSAVADLVKEGVKKDFDQGHRLAKLLHGRITRKVVKQPVMTNVYGVTFHGAKEQVGKQLLDIFGVPTLQDDITVSQLSTYVATLIFGALGKMFNGAQAIQQWLGECGARISQAITPEQIERIAMQREQGVLPDRNKYKRKQVHDREAALAKEDYQFKSAIVWTTPLGMPVVQPYRNAKLKIIKTTFQDIAFEEPALSDPVSKRKQLQAFPPNFIHSLDSSHMMLSALKCNELGLTFASVHDSFWTHACDVPVMNRILRDAFVLMHGEDIIGRLREEFIARYKGCFHYVAVDVRSPLAKQITQLRGDKNKSIFRTSTVTESVQIDELLVEHKRYQLLRNDDPEKQKEGRNMITPGSLFEADPTGALPVLEEDGVQLLGRKVDNRSMMDPMSTPGLEADVPGSEISERVAQSDVDEDGASLVGEGASVELENAAVAEEREPMDEFEHDAKQLDRAQKVKNSRQRKRSWPSLRNKIFLWMPMSFPPAPKKGDFDVRTLKDSQYFFS